MKLFDFSSLEWFYGLQENKMICFGTSPLIASGSDLGGAMGHVFVVHWTID